MKRATASRIPWTLVVAIACVGPVAALAAFSQAAAPAPERPGVTYHKDVEPILQRSCQECHRPGSIAPISLIEFKDVRPWARSIKNRVARREMPPWYIEKGIGVQHFKYDRASRPWKSARSPHRSMAGPSKGIQECRRPRVPTTTNGRSASLT